MSGRGVAAAAVVGGVLLLLPVLAVLLILRSCDESDWHFSARVERVEGISVCLALLGDGPGYVENHCIPIADIVGLPSDVAAGECLRLNQPLHSSLVFEKRRPC